MNPKIQKAAEFLNARGQNSKAFARFHMQVEYHLGNTLVQATIYSQDRTITYAKVVVEETISRWEEEGKPVIEGPGYRVRVSYPAQNDTPANLRYTYLAAALAACELAELVDAHLRFG